MITISTSTLSVADAVTNANHAWSAWRSDGFEREADDNEERQGDHAAEPFEHDRAEGDRGGTDVLRAPGDAHDVAADRRRHHVAHELSGEVVARQRGQRHVRVEQAEHLLPAPGREDDADTGRDDGDAEQHGGAKRVRVGQVDAVEVGNAREQHDEEHGAQPEA